MTRMLEQATRAAKELPDIDQGAQMDLVGAVLSGVVRAHPGEAGGTRARARSEYEGASNAAADTKAQSNSRRTLHPSERPPILPMSVDHIADPQSGVGICTSMLSSVI